MKALSLVGQTFNRLTVLEKVESDSQGSRWQCQCQCGNYRVVHGKKLTAGAVRSCGCLLQEALTKKGKNSTHRMSGTPTYITWIAMRERCGNPNSISYRWYGAKGVRVCSRWSQSFANFLSDMGHRPPGKTLDRIDGRKDYAPENCRWATPLEQRHNRINALESERHA